MHLYFYMDGIMLLMKLARSDIVASLSGALLFIISQKKYHGITRVLMFFISFAMGILGADTTSLLLTQYLPVGMEIDKDTGAFITSALVVTISIRFIDKVNNYFSKK